MHGMLASPAYQRTVATEAAVALKAGQTAQTRHGAEQQDRSANIILLHEC